MAIAKRQRLIYVGGTERNDTLLFEDARAMPLETINREEFDRRLDAANARHAQELQATEDQQAEVEQLLTRYEQTLSEIEAGIEATAETAPLPILLRQRLSDLAERTAQVAASV